LRRIGAIGPSTIQPVVVSRSRLTHAERDAITAALLAVADEPAARPVLDAALVERFVPMTARSYADIRRMYATVRNAQLLDLSWDARWRAISDGVPGFGPSDTLQVAEAT
jgi:ABC-type phosphate/phosphonate transport system substrate-binding protein